MAQQYYSLFQASIGIRGQNVQMADQTGSQKAAS
jgi:hypothetical protein